MQPFARYIASTTDPGPTTWRLLHSRTHGLTLTLLFTTTNIIKKAKQRGDLHFTTNSSLKRKKLQFRALPHIRNRLTLSSTIATS
ncbi:hypothetical protein V1478_002612 [Vespula squamosa]|uniref:Uncharacterized protein n=1 Tax=Vespula squamosa TaxID=30214 RepID=A0ABD2BT22_VESSQ